MRLLFAASLLVATSAAAFLFVRSWRADAKARSTGEMSFEERYPNLPKKALERRARSNAVMREEGVPLNKWLPALETEEEVDLPSTEAVAMRAAATLAVALKGHGMPQERINVLVRDYGLAGWLSPDERTFIDDPSPSERERQIHTWRFEAANALLWAVGFVDRLDGPRTLADPDALASVIVNNTRQQFIARAELRPKSAILDQADLIYRYRWALVDASLNGRSAPAGLNDDVAMERHQALNWLMYHADTEWDDISLDT